MDYVIEVYSGLCSTSKFTIDGINADSDDFVSKYDHDAEHAEDYGCGDMCCDILEPKPEVLKKYGITAKEFGKIADELAEKLSFGSCGWCV